MKKLELLKSLTILTLLASLSGHTLAHAQQEAAVEESTSQEAADQKKIDVDLPESDLPMADLMKEVQAANREVRSVTLETSMTLKAEDDKAKDQNVINGFMDLIYDDDLILQGAYIFQIKEDGRQNKFSKDLLLPSNVKALYSRDSDNQDWQEIKDSIGEDGDYQTNPDFHQLIDTIVAISDDFSVYEHDDLYIIVNNNQDVDLFSAMQPHYDLSVTGISPGQLSKGMFVSFDKETYLLQNLQFVFNFKDETRHLEINVGTITNHINQFDLSDFEIPEEGEVEYEPKEL